MIFLAAIVPTAVWAIAYFVMLNSYDKNAKRKTALYVNELLKIQKKFNEEIDRQRQSYLEAIEAKDRQWKEYYDTLMGGKDRLQS